MRKYLLEFILHGQDISAKIINNSLREFGEGLEVSEVPPTDISGKGKDFCVRLSTIEPEIIFDTCAQLGRLSAIKIGESEVQNG